MVSLTGLYLRMSEDHGCSSCQSPSAYSWTSMSRAATAAKALPTSTLICLASLTSGKPSGNSSDLTRQLRQQLRAMEK
eukprot:11671320-Heterocapsa_arctica.AAC.1